MPRRLEIEAQEDDFGGVEVIITADAVDHFNASYPSWGEASAELEILFHESADAESLDELVTSWAALLN